MNISDFKIGEKFFCGSKEWQCTDKGSRVIVAIHLDPTQNSSWFNGPPYAVSESVFDEYSMEGCSASC